MKDNALNLNELRQIARKMHQSGLSGIEIRNCHYQVRLAYAPRHSIAPAAMPAVGALAVPAAPTTTARAMMPGYVLLHHPTNEKPFTAVGETVAKDALLALIKVGLVYLPLLSPAAGVVASLAVAHGDRVQYDSEIMTIRTAL
ncbi:acetyl-CoA carboxylase biotin carboxyl carrier protein subunit [Brenneria goodwinii]|uniref:Biotin carboxyl carrier protein of acetyl-CoA carboxylase n=1 Tax=Brenneria goodwinii TaxID=1109412 RepID=A0A0G4JYX6_9GAMM|nr:biotin/lipoyl-containing protein [Brenneria goodwinii]MCG8154820.1 acetyl-CoA carboxylase biotin carboxyl carrier protein subunit [Brenneria goodwinii]MCG8159843.1 acetyl-CoA carboxylase biotin carboxyl carrier protein subunit [Brenneria goodwinii]MCG8164058.1 acetyl-CoA carboxylase biotin carboxyl carrier protein subunit [Brenneria goodwinii]MCG8168667.1 acetyl-CoA carboxylase biotin carboxyl carrier protein subunit [Brenneria goodwinii]MCG8173778.1 acetyl-CoA carboxylase biotin carboxyl c